MGSYPTISPLPSGTDAAWRYLFCGTFLEVTPTGRYPARCPVKLGLSSRASSQGASDHLPRSDEQNIAAGAEKILPLIDGVGAERFAGEAPSDYADR